MSTQNVEKFVKELESAGFSAVRVVKNFAPGIEIQKDEPRAKTVQREVLNVDLGPCTNFAAVNAAAAKTGVVIGNVNILHTGTWLINVHDVEAERPAAKEAKRAK